jgi:IclR family pca regulon transcriptional regulator
VRIEGRSFWLNARVLELGRAYLSGLTLAEVALPHLREFVADVKESSSLAVLDGDDIIYVAHVGASRVLSVSVTVGGRDPAWMTSLGRVLLAAQDKVWLENYLARLELRPSTERTIVDREVLRQELARVRRQGWSLVDQEFEEGLRALSVPVRDAEGRVLAAVNVSTYASRWSMHAFRERLLPRLRETAVAIEAELASRVRGAESRDLQARGSPTEVQSADVTKSEARRRSTDFVQSLERGLAVIRAFAGNSSGLTLSEVASATGLTRAAARRFLLTLAELGYVRIEGRSFWLNARVLELGRAYLSGLTLAEVALPHLREFVADVKESSSLAVLDGDDIIYVAHVGASRVLSVSVTVGGRDPAWMTSLGRVLLAAQDKVWLENYLARLELRPSTERTIVDREVLRQELARVRRQGWSLVDQEFEEGLRALSVPVRDAEGRVLAAVNVSTYASRWSMHAFRERLLPRLRETAVAIETDVSFAGGISEALRRQSSRM